VGVGVGGVAAAAVRDPVQDAQRARMQTMLSAVAAALGDGGAAALGIGTTPNPTEAFGFPRFPLPHLDAGAGTVGAGAVGAVGSSTSTRGWAPFPRCV